jgi:hypothetical protein
MRFYFAVHTFACQPASDETFRIDAFYFQIAEARQNWQTPTVCLENPGYSDGKARCGRPIGSCTVSAFLRNRASLGPMLVAIRSQLTFYKESIRQKKQTRPRFSSDPPTDALFLEILLSIYCPLL